jgi:hypothetical protein
MWPSGQAWVCKTFHGGSNPPVTSSKSGGILSARNITTSLSSFEFLHFGRFKTVIFDYSLILREIFRKVWNSFWVFYPRIAGS